MTYIAISHDRYLAITGAWSDNRDKPMRGRTVWVSGAPWDDAYTECTIQAGDTVQGETFWTIATSLHGPLRFRTPAIGIYEEGAPIKPPRKVKGQAKPWKYSAGKWDRFYQD